MKGFEIYNHGTGQEQLGVQVDIFGEAMEGVERERLYI